MIHIPLLLLPLICLPIAISTPFYTPENLPPILWLLTVLTLRVGLPFFVVSTTAPLLQKWFADTENPGSRDPYFLYSASNIGSLLGLLTYPTLIEPYFSLTFQSKLWYILYIILIILISLCAIINWESTPTIKETTTNDENRDNILDRESEVKSPHIIEFFQWIILAFIPSSLLLGVTTYITTDLAAMPMLWAIPLALYLLSFILTFARKQFLPYPQFLAILPAWLTPLIFLCWARLVNPLWFVLLLHLGGFFITACLFHWQLAQRRPNPEHLTSFYWWISVGGVLGGLFNAIAAPLVFNYLLEYPLVMLLSILLVRSRSVADATSPQLLLGIEFANSAQFFTFKKIQTISFGLLFGGLFVGFSPEGFLNNLRGYIIAIGLMILIFYPFNLKKSTWGLGLCFIFLIGQFSLNNLGGILYSERSFFGINRVIQYDNEIGGKYHSLLHGTTMHGKQSIEPKRRNDPLSYFTIDSPIGQFFSSVKPQKLSQVAVLGLGVGTLAAYAKPGQAWTFYEIDPTVEKIARDPRYFTFLQDAKAPYKVILGDGRLQLAQVPDRAYDLLIMDAFSSDSIPVHLVTKEAFQLYFRKIKESGWVLVNISNRYIDLEPVLGAIAHNLGLVAIHQQEGEISQTEKAMGKSASHWVILTQKSENFGSLLQDPRWEAIASNQTGSSPETLIWTDDYSNILSALRWVTQK
jgi:MFS family permease